MQGKGEGRLKDPWSPGKQQSVRLHAVKNNDTPVTAVHVNELEVSVGHNMTATTKKQKAEELHHRGLTQLLTVSHLPLPHAVKPH